ncbi:MAG: hypothetical protein DCC55_00475 [Chloroflexi bacterium]|nr:MAG: hypothetical protein DCC55_00475 [Chloroflexota bacterium]
MRLLRLFGLLAVIAVAYFASYIFHQRSLSEFFPSWLLHWVPALYVYTRWLPADLLTLALWLSAGAALGFGLIVPSLQAEAPAFLERVPRPRARWRSGYALLLLGLAAALAGVILLVSIRNAGGYVQLIWAAAVLLFLAGCSLAAEPRRPAAPSTTPGDPPLIRPEGSWPLFLLILVAAGLLFGWRWLDFPTQIDPEVAQGGLHALALLRGEETEIFTATAVPRLAAVPLALMIALGGDALLGIRLAGLFAALLTVLGGWLLGCELFRRPPRAGPYGEVVEDDGRSAALLAAALLAATPAIISFSRLPFFLEPVAWGGLGLWALLRGLRTGDLLAVGVSGVLHGLAVLLYPSGIVFPLIALFWWVGVWLLQPGWFHPPGRIRERRWLGLGWVGGLAVTIAPQLVIWTQTPDLFLSRFGGTLLPGWGAFLAVLSSAAQRDASFNGAGGWLHPMIAPLLILAVGNLLLNLDRVAGWALFTWSIITLVSGSTLAPLANQWPALLPILPALALALAFTVDRIRVTLLDTVGAWGAQATLYLLFGLVVWLGIWSWSEQRNAVLTTGDSATYTARALRTLPPERVAVLVLGERQAEVNWETPVIRLLAGERLPSAAQRTTTPTAGLELLPPQSTVILQPEERWLLDALQQRYPGGRRTVWRDGNANPMLYMYEVP